VQAPSYKVDVTRPADVAEEVLRIYSYNKVPFKTSFTFNYSQVTPNYVKDMKNNIGDLLAAKGFYEITSNSFVNNKLATNGVKVINPGNAEIDTLRSNLLHSGLEVIAFNLNRKNNNLRLFEFGKEYGKSKSGYDEHTKLALYLTGKKDSESWKTNDNEADLFLLKSFVENVLQALHVDYAGRMNNNDNLNNCFTYVSNKKTIAIIGEVVQKQLNKHDIKQPVLYAELDLDAIQVIINKTANITFKELPRFPSVRRDLALLIDKSTNYNMIEELAWKTDDNILRSVTLFDVYEGKNIEQNKKSYAVSFIFRDNKKTLTDQEVDKVMNKLIANYKKQIGAKLR